MKEKELTKLLAQPMIPLFMYEDFSYITGIPGWLRKSNRRMVGYDRYKEARAAKECCICDCKMVSEEGQAESKDYHEIWRIENKGSTLNAHITHIIPVCYQCHAALHCNLFGEELGRYLGVVESEQQAIEEIFEQLPIPPVGVEAHQVWSPYRVWRGETLGTCGDRLKIVTDATFLEYLKGYHDAKD